MPHNTHVFNGLNDDFYSFSISAVDQEEFIVGRPYGGLTILWRKSVDHMCKVINFSDNRILGLELSADGRQLLALNVYLPFYCPENTNNYLFYIGKTSAIMEDSNTSEFMVLGDFNANNGSSFFRHWDAVCRDYDTVFTDVTSLPATSYTHVNKGSLTCSWIDHCLCSRTVHGSIREVSIDYNYYDSDHLPLTVSLDYPCLPVSIPESGTESRTKWTLSEEDRVD